MAINKVQTIANNISGNISAEILNEKYLEGYILDLELIDPIIQNAGQPKKILISKGIETIDLLTKGKD